MDIGNVKTMIPGARNTNTCNAAESDRPASTTRRTSSNRDPTAITKVVKAPTPKRNGSSISERT
jgi:hypothetical protein